MPALIVIAVIAGLLGLLMASQATTGVAFVGVGCLFAILARIVQADRHHRLAHPPVLTPEEQARRDRINALQQPDHAK